MAKIDLINRQDLFALISSTVVRSVVDTVSYEIPLHNISKTDLVFIILPNSLKSKFQPYEEDIALKQYPAGNTSHVVLSTSHKTVDKYVDQATQKLVENCLSTLLVLYVSSHISVVPNSNLLIRGTFKYSRGLVAAQIQLVQTLAARISEELS
jgi:hypothetical protein